MVAASPKRFLFIFGGVECGVTSKSSIKMDKGVEYKTWMCVVCGLIYDEQEGWPEDEIAPGTRWQDVSENWICPDCGAGKDDFEMIEI